jgi:hypothetical protein
VRNASAARRRFLSLISPRSVCLPASAITFESIAGSLVNRFSELALPQISNWDTSRLTAVNLRQSRRPISLFLDNGLSVPSCFRDSSRSGGSSRKLVSERLENSPGDMCNSRRGFESRVRTIDMHLKETKGDDREEYLA